MPTILRGVVLIAAIAFGLAGCSSNPAGSDWAVADFNKYGNNYVAFPTEQLHVGMPKSEAERLFSNKLIRVSADTSSESFVVEKWVSVAGPDYIDERLHLRFQGGRLSDWKVVKAETLTLVPRRF